MGHKILCPIANYFFLIFLAIYTVYITLIEGIIIKKAREHFWATFIPVYRDIVLFKNEDYYTNERILGNLPLTFRDFFDKYDSVSTYSLYPKFSIEHGYKNFDAQVDKMIDIAAAKENTFTYCYYDEPDASIHKYGTTGKKVKKVIEKLDSGLERLSKHLKEDSIMFVIADHGLIDCETIYLEDYPDIIDQLVLKPTIESRCTSFKVADMERFKRLFEHYFPIGFELYTKDEYLRIIFLSTLSITGSAFSLLYLPLTFGITQ